VPRFAIAPLGLTTEGNTKFKLKGWKCYLKKLQCWTHETGQPRTSQSDIPPCGPRSRELKTFSSPHCARKPAGEYLPSCPFPTCRSFRDNNKDADTAPAPAAAPARHAAALSPSLEPRRSGEGGGGQSLPCLRSPWALAALTKKMLVFV